MKRIYLNNLEEEVFLDDDGLEVLFFPDRLDDLVDPLVGVFLVQRGQQRFQVSGRVQTEPESAHLEREAQPGLQRRRHLWVVYFSLSGRTALRENSYCVFSFGGIFAVLAWNSPPTTFVAAPQLHSLGQSEQD